MALKPNSENIDAFQMWWNASQQLTRTDNAGHTKNPNGHDFYGRIQLIESDVSEIKQAVSKLQGGGSVTVDIDYEKLADAVADKFAARMKS